MNTRLALIRQRRELLILRARAQRLELAGAVQDWHKAFDVADRLLAAARRVNRYWLAYAVVLAFFVRARRVPFGLWIGRIWTAWEIYRSLRRPRLRAPLTPRHWRTE